MMKIREEYSLAIMENKSIDLNQDYNSSTTSTWIETPIFMYVFLGSSVIGGFINLCIIGVIIFNRNYRRPANYLVAFLAFTSIFSIGWTSLQPYETVKGKEWLEIAYFCEFTTFIRRLHHPMMSFTTVAIALDRKRFMNNPLARPNALLYIRQMLIIFFASLILSIPRWFEKTYDPTYMEPQLKCKHVSIADVEWLTIVYNTLYLICTYILPTIILLREIWLSRTIIRCLFSETDRHFVLEDKRAQFIIIICLFSLGFILFWPQHGIFYFLINLPDDTIGLETRQHLERCWYFSRSILYAYTTTNPTLLLVLCFDWQWTTIIQMIRQETSQQQKPFQLHRRRPRSM